MALTGPAPFAGYPDYENHGDVSFIRNIYDGYSGDRGGVLFVGGAGQTSQIPVTSALFCDGRFLSSTYGPKGTGPFPWGADTLGLSGFASAPWTLNLTWTVTRYTFDGSMPTPTGVTTASRTVVATNAVPNGWSVALSLSDVVAACQHPDAPSAPAGTTVSVGPFASPPHVSADGQSVGYTGGTLFTFGANPSVGSFTFTSPSSAGYGQYQFSCTADYHLTQAPGPYRPPVDTPLKATFTLTSTLPPPYAVIQTGAGHLTITNDPSLPALGTLTGSNGVYTYTSTGPVYVPSATQPPHRLLDIQVTVDTVPAEPTYLGPKLLSISLPIPPGDGSNNDLTTYKASHTDPFREPGAMTDFGSVLLPLDAPNGAAVYRWKMPAPYYAGQYTIFFVPISSFGPQYVYPAQTGDVNDFGNGQDGYTRTLLPPSPARNYTTHQEIGLVPPFLAKLSVNVTPTGGSTVPKNNAPGITPNLLGHPSRHYNRAVSALNSNGTATTGVLFWRSIRAIPLLNAFAGGVVWDTPGPGIFVTSAVNDNTPSLAEDARGLLYCLFNRPAQGAMITRSDDDGDTWNTPVMAIPGGARPVLVSSEGHMICAAMTTTGTAPNLIHHITAVYRGPGDAVFGTPYPFQFLSGGTFAPLSVADDSIGMAFTDEGAGRLGLHVLMAGESTTSDWWSADNGATWTRIPLV